jgi:hypothetical protein
MINTETITVKEVLELTKEMSIAAIAKQFGVGKEKISKTLKELGAEPPKSRNMGEGWYYKQVEALESKMVTYLERKSVTRNNERSKEPTNEQTKEVTNVIRKRASFDIDVALLKELKIHAIQRDKNVYEVVEQAIRQYLKG